MNRSRSFLFGLGGLLASCFLLISCAHTSTTNEGHIQSYPEPVIEAGWIRDGQPIEYDGQKWYPVNDVEVLLDSEVYQITEYKGVQIFVDKVDTKPYHRLYTKFARNKFRYFEKRTYDQS
ncbi:MAG: hypothetical protein WCH62_02975 [Candidatus Omnitrophota bacterium]